MPRTARIDIPNLLQHVIVRGIERRNIFTNHGDRLDFVTRFSGSFIRDDIGMGRRDDLVGIGKITGVQADDNGRRDSRVPEGEDFVEEILCRTDTKLPRGLIAFGGCG